MQSVAENPKAPIEDFCNQIGLKGNLKRMIVSGIKSELQLSNFKLFVLEKNPKNKFVMVSEFLMSMDIRDNISRDIFVEMYKNGDKVYALESVCRGHYDSEVLHKVEDLIKNGLTLGTFYDKLLFENKSNVHNVLNLLK